MKQVTIVGLGLIGASLGLALKRLKTPPRVIGNDVQYDAARHASGIKAVDRVERNLAAAVEGSDMVVVATPVGAIAEVLQGMSAALAEGCVVTDTGSTKREILRWADELLPKTVGFVGGHPMTGRATGGVDEPDGSIFEGSVYCLAPSLSTAAPSVQKVADMVVEIGARPYFVDPAEHDGLVAAVSHIPYLLSAALMRAVSSESGWREMSALAAGGFDTSTRLAAHNPRMYADILATNSDNVVRHLDRLMDELAAIRGKLLAGDAAIRRDLEEAQRQRQQWEAKRRAREER